jgi:hypothetical protein
VIRPDDPYHTVVEQVDLMSHTVLKVAVSGLIVRYRRCSVIGKSLNAHTQYSNAMDPAGRLWPTEEQAEAAH